MIRHIIKIIWNERKANAWIMFEFILVFCILWFCTDFLFYMNKKALEPRGFDIEHVYKLDMGRIADKFLSEKQKADVKNEYEEAMTIKERLLNYPSIEAVSFSLAAMPYSNSSTTTTFYADTASVHPLESGRKQWVSDDYFKVFRINFQRGGPFVWNDPDHKNKVVVAPNYKDEIFDYPTDIVNTVKERQGRGEDEKEVTFEITGVTDKVKYNDYENYMNIVYFPIEKSYLSEICFRVSPEADKNFIERFTNDMRERLTFGRRYMQRIEPLSVQRERRIRDTTNTLNGVYAVTTFLIVNIFLGIIGTFWFRTQSRQSEIGLRVALGASKRKVKSTMMLETLMLLFVASIVSVIICLNVGQTDILESIGVPRIDRKEYMIGKTQDIINYVITFVFLAVISLLAVWYPANQAANMQPAEALRDE